MDPTAKTLRDNLAAARKPVAQRIACETQRAHVVTTRYTPSQAMHRAITQRDHALASRLGSFGKEI